jgi:uncharacterized protein with GYD domain
LQPRPRRERNDATSDRDHEEGPLPHFILLTKLTSEGVKTIKNNPDRIAEVNREMEQIGLKVHDQWATLGRYDFVSIVEADSPEVMAKASVELGSRGTTVNETLSAIPSGDFAGSL